MKKLKFLLLIFTIFSIINFSACGGSGGSGGGGENGGSSGGTTLTSIAVTPVNPTIATGNTQQFIATGTYSNSSTQDLTASVAWNSSNTGVATINSGGLATGVAAGSTTITATSGTISGNTLLTVTSSGGGGGGTTLTSIAVTPSNTNVSRGGTKQFTATGTYSDSTTQDITTSVTWGSSDNSIADINTIGLATASSNKSGPVTITATYGSISGNTQFMVAVNLPKTGQTTSYATGDDGNLQKGVAWPSPRFADNGDGTVTDNLTGLIWLKNANCFGTRTWTQALSDANNLASGSCGLTDGSSAGNWRLPNVNELRSLINHYGQANISTWLNGQGFINVQDWFYWSSTTVAYNLYNARNVNYGGELLESLKVNYYYVWPVRTVNGVVPANVSKTGQATCYDVSGNAIPCAGTGQDGDLQKGVTWPSPRFIDNGDSTVTDNLTGLMWLKDANCIATQYPSFDTGGTAGDGLVSWQNSLDFVVGINNGTYSKCGVGYNDWRLPNVNELPSLINAEQSNNSTWLNGQGFINVQLAYWSSTTSAANSGSNAWYIFIDGAPGSMFVGSKTTGIMAVWPVRAGQ